MKNMKFLLKDADQSKRLQEVLFSLGHHWLRGKVVQYTDRVAIFTYEHTADLSGCGSDFYHGEVQHTATDAENFIAEHSSVRAVEPEALTGKVKSDGGSTDYYKLTIKTKSGFFECETGDVIAALVGDNFALGNALKALRRIWCESQGVGKEGIDMHYDAKKINYFVADFIERSGR
jgi:hypothetical protein